MIHFDVSLNTVANGLIVAAFVGVAKILWRTAMALSNLQGQVKVHIRDDEQVHARVFELERRVG